MNLNPPEALSAVSFIAAFVCITGCSLYTKIGNEKEEEKHRRLWQLALFCILVAIFGEGKQIIDILSKE